MLIKFIFLSSFLALSIAYKDDYQSIELPIKSLKHDLEIIKTPSEVNEHVTYVDVPGGHLPVYITFKTQSSPVNVKQEHRGTKGSVQKTDSKDEPHKLIHEVIKPIYQEIKEIIQPYRKVVQVIEPVKEERYTKVHKGERKTKYEGNGGYGDNSGYGSNSGGYGDNSAGNDNSGGGYGAHRVGSIGNKYGVSSGDGYDNTDDSYRLPRVRKMGAKYGMIGGVRGGNGYGDKSGGYGDNSDSGYEIKSAAGIGDGYVDQRVGKSGNKYAVLNGDEYGVNSESGYGKIGNDRKYLRLDHYYKTYGHLEDNVKSLKTYVD